MAVIIFCLHYGILFCTNKMHTVSDKIFVCFFSTMQYSQFQSPMNGPYKRFIKGAQNLHCFLLNLHVYIIGTMLGMHARCTVSFGCMNQVHSHTFSAQIHMV